MLVNYLTDPQQSRLFMPRVMNAHLLCFHLFSLGDQCALDCVRLTAKHLQLYATSELDVRHASVPEKVSRGCESVILANQPKKAIQPPSLLSLRLVLKSLRLVTPPWQPSLRSAHHPASDTH